MLEAFALASAFAGAAIYISVAEHPARLKLEERAMFAQWRPAYARGYAMQATIAMMSGLLALGIGFRDGDGLWLLGALLMLANWPFTLLAVNRVNKALEAAMIETASDTSSGKVRWLMRRWGHLHGVRAILGTAATLVFILAAAR